MCRLLGIMNFDARTHRDLVWDFFGLAERGAVPPGNPLGHLDGWGIGWYDGGKARLEKSGLSALAEAERITGLVTDMGKTPVFIAHLRKAAWDDTATGRHAHPFLHDNVLFAHNGTVLEYQPLLAGLPPALAPERDALDTEVLFRTVLAAPGATLQEKLAVAVARARQLPYTAMNILISDGKCLIAYRDYTKYADYYTLFTARAGDAAFVCSEELPSAGEWTALTNGQMLAVEA